MNLPNRLTVARLLAVPFFLLLLQSDHWLPRLGAMVLFIAAGITDLVDGYLARKYNLVTPLGIFLDPLADKLIITAAFIAFLDIPALHIPAWMVVCIVGREFILTGLRGVAATQGRSVPADDGGKLKTAVQNTAIIAILFALVMTSFFRDKTGIALTAFSATGGWRAQSAWLIDWAPYYMVAVATAVSVLTGVNYLRKHWALLKETP